MRYMYMKRCSTKTAIFLLAVYLPMWLLSSLHVHHYHSDNNGTPTEQRSTDTDEDGCLLCQFLQLVYEEPQQCVVRVVIPETKFEAVPLDNGIVSVLEPAFSSRAPPFLL